jgi:hypothetical protein
VADWVHLDVDEIKAETAKAFLLRLESGEEVWIPKSQISDADDYEKGDTNAVVSVTEWIAKQNGLA